MIMDALTATVLLFSIAFGVLGFCISISNIRSIEQLKKRITKLEENAK